MALVPRQTFIAVGCKSGKGIQNKTTKWKKSPSKQTCYMWLKAIEFTADNDYVIATTSCFLPHPLKCANWRIVPMRLPKESCRKLFYVISHRTLSQLFKTFWKIFRQNVSQCFDCSAIWFAELRSRPTAASSCFWQASNFVCGRDLLRLVSLERLLNQNLLGTNPWAGPNHPIHHILSARPNFCFPNGPDRAMSYTSVCNMELTTAWVS